MFELTLDEHENNFIRGPATMEEICNWAKNFEKNFFDKIEPNIEINIVPDENMQGLVCFDYTDGRIYFSQTAVTFRKTCRIALLHEMVHIKLYTENGDPDAQHGERFQAQITRLFNAGAYKGLL